MLFMEGLTNSNKHFIAGGFFSSCNNMRFLTLLTFKTELGIFLSGIFWVNDGFAVRIS